MRVGIVINPISGRHGSRRGEGERRRSFMQSHVEAAGVNATIVLTERIGHARQLARTFVDEGCETVIAMGGDGTINEVGHALVGTTTPLGIVPAGSGNGLACGLGLPTDHRQALRIALSPSSTPIDVGTAGDRIFLNIAGVGFDAAVGELFAGRATRGPVGYVNTTLRLVWKYVSRHYELTWHTGEAEERREGKMFLVGFANAPTYGNSAVLAPDASYQDGVLDLVLIAAGAPLQQIWRARRFYFRHRTIAYGLERSRAIRATLRATEIMCHVDGEVFTTRGALKIGVLPKALFVRRP